jgi:hypothetical protein
MWAGAIATRAMAIQTGAEGAFWPLLAGGFGAIVFGLMADARLPAMMEQLAQFRPEPQPGPQPTPRPPPKMEEPEPKVIYLSADAATATETEGRPRRRRQDHRSLAAEVARGAISTRGGSKSMSDRPDIAREAARLRRVLLLRWRSSRFGSGAFDFGMLMTHLPVAQSATASAD